MDSYSFVKKFYKDKLNIPEELTDFLSVELVIKGCAEGLSNNRIANRYGLDNEYIKIVLIELFQFEGWKKDLDFSPLAVYNRNKGELLSYKLEVVNVSPYVDFDKYVELSHDICKKYNDVKKELDKYYG